MAQAYCISIFTKRFFDTRAGAIFTGYILCYFFSLFSFQYSVRLSMKIFSLLFFEYLVELINLWGPLWKPINSKIHILFWNDTQFMAKHKYNQIKVLKSLLFTWSFPKYFQLPKISLMSFHLYYELYINIHL